MVSKGFFSPTKNRIKKRDNKIPVFWETDMCISKKMKNKANSILISRQSPLSIFSEGGEKIGHSQNIKETAL